MYLCAQKIKVREVRVTEPFEFPNHLLQCVAVHCSVLQCVAVRYSVLQCVAVCCSVLQCVAVCCREVRVTEPFEFPHHLLQCVAVR